MDSTYKQPDHSGPEPLPHHDAPEVVPGTEPRVPIEHLTSGNSPQVQSPSSQQNQRYQYFGAQPEVRPYYEEHYGEKPSAAKGDRDAEKHAINMSRRGTLCGLRPRIFFWILAAVILVLVIAAILGGVLGSMYGGSSGSDSQPESAKHNNSASLPSIDSKTGLAVLRPEGASTLYQYYQDGQGRIIENRYYDEEWSIQSNKIPSYSIIGNDAQSGSPIAATSWESSGTVFRQVFYLDENGRIMSSNTTGINDWPTPYNILPDDSAMFGTKALAVCSDTDETGLNGLRVYFASSDMGIIREVGTDFGDNIEWFLWATFANSDPHSGVATILADQINHLYIVNSSTGHLVQWMWDYDINDDTSWAQTASSALYIAGESDIAAVYDGFNTDHIFYEGSDSKLVRALYSGQSFTQVKELDALAHDAQFSTAWDSESNNGATVFFRDQSDPKEIRYETINRSGHTVQSGIVD